jgi:hypothetical protein
MPTLSLNFAQYTAQDTVYPTAGWITNVRWQNAVLGQIINTGGVYAIDDGANCVYAGRANNVRARFGGGRQRTFREFRLLGAGGGALNGYRVWAASVTVAPAMANRVAWAEKWLVRWLFLRDAALATQWLQNVDLTAALTIPAGGLNIRFMTAAAPPYIQNAGDPRWINVGAGMAGYNYAGGFVL